MPRSKPKSKMQPKPKLGPRVRSSGKSTPPQSKSSRNAIAQYSGQYGTSLTASYGAERIGRLPGMSNLPEITFSYSTGTIQHYNFGTVTGSGAANNLVSFFVDNTGVVFYASYIPILPGDGSVGQSYISDIMKHFARRVVHKLFVVAEARNPNTSQVTNSSQTYSNGLHFIAPLRGGNIDPNSGNLNAPNVVGASLPQLSTLQSVSDVVPFSTWQNAVLDLTGHIAGGSGSKQNEFNNYNNAGISSVTNSSNSLASAAAFVVTGSNGLDLNTATGDIRVVTHNVRVVITVSLLDYIGGMSVYMPNGNNPALSKQEILPTDRSALACDDCQFDTDCESVKIHPKSLCSPLPRV